MAADFIWRSNVSVDKTEAIPDILLVESSIINAESVVAINSHLNFSSSVILKSSLLTLRQGSVRDRSGLFLHYFLIKSIVRQGYQRYTTSSARIEKKILFFFSCGRGTSKADPW